MWLPHSNVSHCAQSQRHHRCAHPTLLPSIGRAPPAPAGARCAVLLGLERRWLSATLQCPPL